MSKQTDLFCDFKRSSNPHIVNGKASTFICPVPTYKIADDGTTICEVVPEKTVQRCTNGKDLELCNMLYASMPELVGQLPMLDPMASAEQITTESVRRFGTLNKQFAELKKLSEQTSKLDE